jgi:hypothetical protein
MMYWIESAESCVPNATIVKVRVPGSFFPKQACSECGILSEGFPSFIEHDELLDTDI